MHFQQLTRAVFFEKVPLGAFSHGALQRIFLVVVALFLWMPMGVTAQSQVGTTILVVVPSGTDLNDPDVTRWVELLKQERQLNRLSATQLPILRLGFDELAHRTRLAALGIADSSRVQTFRCETDRTGWPQKVVRPYSVEMGADEVISDHVKVTRDEQTSSFAPNIGILLLTTQETQKLTKPFLQELGRFWLGRYGRVQPNPYPLASYDLSRLEVADAIRRDFPPECYETSPVVALCRFENLKPVEVLRTYRQFQTPARLVRELSAERTALLARTNVKEKPLASAPKAQELGIDSQQERILMVSRLQETAFQLWEQVATDSSDQNRRAKQTVLKIMEECRQYLDGDEQIWNQFLDSLKDYAVEPLSSADESLTPLMARFRHLGEALLEKF